MVSRNRSCIAAADAFSCGRHGSLCAVSVSLIALNDSRGVISTPLWYACGASLSPAHVFSLMYSPRNHASTAGDIFVAAGAPLSFVLRFASSPPPAADSPLYVGNTSGATSTTTTPLAVAFSASAFGIPSLDRQSVDHIPPSGSLLFVEYTIASFPPSRPSRSCAASLLCKTHATMAAISSSGGHSPAWKIVSPMIIAAPDAFATLNSALEPGSMLMTDENICGVSSALNPVISSTYFNDLQIVPWCDRSDDSIFACSD